MASIHGASSCDQIKQCEVNQTASEKSHCPTTSLLKRLGRWDIFQIPTTIPSCGKCRRCAQALSWGCGVVQVLTGWDRTYPASTGFLVALCSGGQMSNLCANRPMISCHACATFRHTYRPFFFLRILHAVNGLNSSECSPEKDCLW